jgi:3'-phosphoadenosine 5'-phosphosulfate sulfotransferase (PAPS reductase)/FAD synthetase
MSLVQLALYPSEPPVIRYSAECSDEILTHLSQGSPVAIGVSGGKDSSALAVRTMSFLDDIAHAGPRVLIHSDLGSIEWQSSLSVCQDLADRLGVELVTVRRKRGDLVQRWRQRWADNVRRYASLACVQLILPWSTPQMRFCTSELKVQVICQELVQRFPSSVIISASGIRRQESTARAKAPVSRIQSHLVRSRFGTSGYDWHPILGWTDAEVFEFLQRHNVPLHEAYTRYGSSRLSCAFCILASRADLLASSRCEYNQNIYRQIVELELESTFSFQAGRWLADVAPHLLSKHLREQILNVKQRALQREAAEAEIPKSLLYTAGWPTRIPSWNEAALLANVRRRVAKCAGIQISFVEPEEIVLRYQELMDLQRTRTAKQLGVVSL